MPAQTAAKRPVVDAKGRIKAYVDGVNDGKSIEEIAQELGIKASSLTVWISNMRKELKKQGVDLPTPRSRRQKRDIGELAEFTKGLVGGLDRLDAEQVGDAVEDANAAEAEAEQVTSDEESGVEVAE